MTDASAYLDKLFGPGPNPDIDKSSLATILEMDDDETRSWSSQVVESCFHQISYHLRGLEEVIAARESLDDAWKLTKQVLECSEPLGFVKIADAMRTIWRGAFDRKPPLEDASRWSLVEKGLAVARKEIPVVKEKMKRIYPSLGEEEEQA